MAKNTVFIKIINAIGLFAVIIGGFMAFTPLRMFGLIPLFFALAFSAFAIYKATKTNARTWFAIMVLGVAVFSISYSVVTRLVEKPKVANDQEFIEKMEQSAQEGSDELDDLLDELE